MKNMRAILTSKRIKSESIFRLSISCLIDVGPVARRIKHVPPPSQCHTFPHVAAVGSASVLPVAESFFVSEPCPLSTSQGKKSTKYRLQCLSSSSKFRLRVQECAHTRTCPGQPRTYICGQTAEWELGLMISTGPGPCRSTPDLSG